MMVKTSQRDSVLQLNRKKHNYLDLTLGLIAKYCLVSVENSQWSETQTSKVKSNFTSKKRKEYIKGDIYIYMCVCVHARTGLRSGVGGGAARGGGHIFIFHLNYMFI